MPVAMAEGKCSNPFLHLSDKQIQWHAACGKYKYSAISAQTPRQIECEKWQAQSAPPVFPVPWILDSEF